MPPWCCSTAVLGVFEALRRGEASDALERQAVLVSDVVGEMVGGAVVAGDKASIEAQLRGLVSRGQVLGVVVLDRGHTAAGRGAQLAAQGQPPLGVACRRSAPVITVELRGLPALATFQPLLEKDEVVGGIWLAVDREPVVAASRRFYTVALLLLVGLVGCCMVIATIGAEGIVRPLDDLGETVAALGGARWGAASSWRVPRSSTVWGDGSTAWPRPWRPPRRRSRGWPPTSTGRCASAPGSSRRQSRRFSTMANTDPLTGLTNRRGLEIELDRYLSLSRRNQQPLAVIMMDLDNFKTYNDKCGHLSGDTVLKAVAAALRGRARASDVVARWGGDEFCLLIPATDPDGALAATQRFVIAVLEAMADLSRSDVSAVLGARAGLACYPEDGDGGGRAHRPRRRRPVQGQGLGRQRRAARQPQVDGDLTGEGARCQLSHSPRPRAPGWMPAHGRFCLHVHRLW